MKIWLQTICRYSPTRQKLTLMVSILLLAHLPNSVAEEMPAISHIHNIRVVDNKILLGTHEGFYQYVNKKQIKRLGTEDFDVMGLSTNGNLIFASGHPGATSKLAQPVGLLQSSDLGKSWQKVSLAGKVDFHFLESFNSEFYGADSIKGELYYSKDFGKNWEKRGDNSFNDIAVNPAIVGSALALRNGSLFTSADSLKRTKVVKISSQLTSIEWNAKRLIATAGEKLLISKNSGKTWQVLYSFNGLVGTIAQSNSLIVAVVGDKIFTSSNDGKSFTQK